MFPTNTSYCLAICATFTTTSTMHYDFLAIVSVTDSFSMTLTPPPVPTIQNASLISTKDKKNFHSCRRTTIQKNYLFFGVIDLLKQIRVIYASQQ